MAVPNINSMLSEKSTFLEGDRKKSYLSGFLCGVRLSKKLIEGKIAGTWNGDLHSIASNTYMGEMRSLGTKPGEFIKGLQRGSNNTIGLSENELPNPSLMEDSELGTNYALGIFDSVNVCFADGFKHFIEGYSFSRDEGSKQIFLWIDIVEAQVISRMEQEQRGPEGNSRQSKEY